MTITDTQTAPTRFQLVAFDLYKDIHKAIRSELFAVLKRVRLGAGDVADPEVDAR